MPISHDELKRMTEADIKKISIEDLMHFDDEIYAEILTAKQINALTEVQVAAIGINLYQQINEKVK